MSRPRSSSRQNFLSSIRGRFVSIVGLFVLGLVAMVATLTWMDAGDMYAGRRSELKAVVEVAHKTVEQQYNEFKSGKISEAEAQARAKASLRAMRYDGTDYLFVLDKNVFTIVHGARPDHEGVDHSQERDPTGKYFSREMRDVAFAKGEGYVDYQFAKPGAPSDQPSPKLSYGKLFAPWEWVLCTGMYVDDVEATIWRRVLINALSALAILAVIGGLIAAMMFRMSNRINGLNAAMTRLAAGERDVALPGSAGNDEIGDMARAVEIFKQNAIERARLEAESAANRSTSEAERERAAAERVKAAEEQAEVVRRLSAGLKEVAEGDLMVLLSDGFSPAYAQVRDDFNETISKLKQTIVAVVASAGAIRSGANEISVASDDLSRRTEQQAANLEETAATLSEVTTTVKKSAEGTSHARQVVASADEDAKKSAVVVRKAVDAMSAIAKSSQQISQIIGVIDEIAFQTNLLALNAGVEAARAGDAGKGFAVVASEVRALAQRSAEAAKEIKGLISDSTVQVDAGVKLVAETGKSLERIMAQVGEINTVVADIAAGSREQATALQEINAAIEQMNLVTQQNSAMVLESTTAGHSLSEESSKLTQLVSQFRTGRAAGEETMRRELQKVAPHAFSTPARATGPASSPSRPAAKIAAAG